MLVVARRSRCCRWRWWTRRRRCTPTPTAILLVLCRAQQRKQRLNRVRALVLPCQLARSLTHLKVHGSDVMANDDRVGSRRLAWLALPRKMTAGPGDDDRRQSLPSTDFRHHPVVRLHLASISLPHSPAQPARLQWERCAPRPTSRRSTTSSRAPSRASRAPCASSRSTSSRPACSRGTMWGGRGALAIACGTS